MRLPILCRPRRFPLYTWDDSRFPRSSWQGKGCREADYNDKRTEQSRADRAVRAIPCAGEKVKLTRPCQTSHHD